jgi:hypothetical protein
MGKAEYTIDITPEEALSRMQTAIENAKGHPGVACIAQTPGITKKTIGDLIKRLDFRHTDTIYYQIGDAGVEFQTKR